MVTTMGQVNFKWPTEKVSPSAIADSLVNNFSALIMEVQTSMAKKSHPALFKAAENYKEGIRNMVKMLTTDQHTDSNTNLCLAQMTSTEQSKAKTNRERKRAETQTSKKIPKDSSKVTIDQKQSPETPKADEYGFEEKPIIRIYNPLNCTPSAAPKTWSSYELRSKRKALSSRHRNPEKERSRTNERKLRTYNNMRNEFCQRFINQVNLGPPKNFVRLITSNRLKLLVDLNLNACAIGLECLELRTKDESGEEKVIQVPCWVSIIDSDGEVVLNEFIRHPSASIKKMLHGMTFKQIQYAPNFYQVRSKVIDELVKYKRIVVCSQAQAFEDLFLDHKDYHYLLSRLIDITSYYNCYKDYDATELELIIFTMFGEIFHEGQHSPLLDAAYSMYLYLMDLERIEAHQSLIENQMPMPVHEGVYQSYKYPKNKLFAGLLQDIMSFIGDLPRILKIRLSTRVKQLDDDSRRRSFSNVQVCETILRPRPIPYEFEETEFHKFLTVY